MYLQTAELKDERKFKHFINQLKIYPESFNIFNNTMPTMAKLSISDLISDKYPEINVKSNQYIENGNTVIRQEDSYSPNWVYHEEYDYSKDSTIIWESDSSRSLYSEDYRVSITPEKQYSMFSLDKMEYLYQFEEELSSENVSNFISENIDCYIKGYEFIYPLHILIEQEEDYFICYDDITNLYGTGLDIEEAKKDYCEFLIERFIFLSENQKNQFPGYIKEYEYLKSVVRKR